MPQTPEDAWEAAKQRADAQSRVAAGGANLTEGLGRRQWKWECWALWLATAYMAIATLGSGEAGNPYVAAMLIMAFIHYTRPNA